MTTGIVLTAAAPTLLVFGAVLSEEALNDCNARNTSAVSSYSDCQDASKARGYFILGTSLVMLGVGIPLIVVGGKKIPLEPAAQAHVVPWVSPQSAGLALHVSL